MLPEMNGLEKEMINLTFNQDHADQGGLWIRDVEDHLTKLNEENGGIASEELQQFVTDCIDFTNFRKGILNHSPYFFCDGFPHLHIWYLFLPELFVF